MAIVCMDPGSCAFCSHHKKRGGELEAASSVCRNHIIDFNPAFLQKIIVTQSVKLHSKIQINDNKSSAEKYYAIPQQKKTLTSS